jgi:hypothetical protein
MPVNTGIRLWLTSMVSLDCASSTRLPEADEYCLLSHCYRRVVCCATSFPGLIDRRLPLSTPSNGPLCFGVYNTTRRSYRQNPFLWRAMDFRIRRTTRQRCIADYERCQHYHRWGGSCSHRIDSCDSKCFSWDEGDLGAARAKRKIGHNMSDHENRRRVSSVDERSKLPGLANVQNGHYVSRSEV